MTRIWKKNQKEMTRKQKYKEYKKEWTGYEKANKTTQWHGTDMKKQKIQQNGMTRMRKYKIIQQKGWPETIIYYNTTQRDGPDKHTTQKYDPDTKIKIM